MSHLFGWLGNEYGVCHLNYIVVLSTAMFFKTSFSRVFLFSLVLLALRYLRESKKIV